MIDGLAEDGVGGFPPDECSGSCVPAVDEASDRPNEVSDAPVAAASDVLAGEDGQSALGHVHPGRAGGGEVAVKAPLPWLGEPAHTPMRRVRALRPERLRQHALHRGIVTCVRPARACEPEPPQLDGRQRGGDRARDIGTGRP